MIKKIKKYFQKLKLNSFEKAENRRKNIAAQDELIRINNANRTLWQAEQKYDRGHPAYLPTIDD